MINISSWLKEGIISGYRRSELTFTKVTEAVAAYIVRGLLSEFDAAEIVAACTPPVIPQPETSEKSGAEEDSAKE